MPTEVHNPTANTTATSCGSVAFDFLPLNWGLPAAIVTSYLLLALQDDLHLAIPLLTATTALVTIFLAIAFYAGERGRLSRSPRQVLLLAAAFRLLFVWRPPELSDDIFRYLWDGLQTLAGNNPYALPPAAAPLPGGTAAGLAKMVNHPDLVTIYPPAAQLVLPSGPPCMPERPD